MGARWSAGTPRVFHGPIASANILLKVPEKRDELRDKFKVKAAEMESSGIADATWGAGRGGYLVIRGSRLTPCSSIVATMLQSWTCLPSTSN